MVGKLTVVRLVLAMFVLSSLLATSWAQTTCASHTFTNNKVFATCRDLPHLTSYLHWTYEESTGKLDLAFRHTGISATDRWVSWAINPSGSLSSTMVGAQALVAVSQSGGTPTVYTSSISSYGTQLAEGSISYNHTALSATRQNSEITIYATLTLPSGTTTLVHLWQDGPLSGSTPSMHAQDSSNLQAKESLDLVSGSSQAGSSGGSLRRRRNVHGVLNALSWGTLMPLGAIIARYLKVFKSADPAWFYLHVTCQTSAYIIGVAGWGTGLKLGSDSVGIKYNTHRTLGIVLFCLGTLQVFALLLRPNKDNKYRFYWNIYHYAIGYATIIISIVNIFKGFDALENSVGDRYNDWKHAYIGIIAALGGIAVLLEAYTWIIVLKRRNTERKTAHGTNGINGYGSRPQQVV
ncbi:cytochrome b561 and DOMON domain-containing protein At4g17280 [Cajanus cajan]|uniref:Cytochrome b561 and DOMON domain-containing protein n=1 Tax=Cajanus cajan TaxID=3821 RepID=A0A151T6K5_CAJCA|nr:cytochrome b561 and DOMON domain-containing protein At4g17280 [Cajanus cajan]KYP62673.1 Auxin-induced in root cultures protein 12 [Cajanus cajan]